MVVNQRPPEAPALAPHPRANARCGRCGASYSWDGGRLTYLGVHDQDVIAARR